MKKMVNGVLVDMTQSELDEHHVLQAQYYDNYERVTRDNQLLALKTARDAGKLAPITVGSNTFDLDKEAQININTTLEAFDAVRVEAVSLGWPDDGTVPWVLADNTTIPVTLNDLQAVKEAGAARGIRLHMEYGAAKASLI